MSLSDFIRAIPKADPFVYLLGALHPKTVTLIAEQNKIAAGLKRYDQWIAELNSPDPAKSEELMNMIGTWIRLPEDVTRAVYDLGVNLSKDNVQYAEVYLDPTVFVGNGMSADVLVAALEDGRDRVERAWNVKLRWIFTIHRDRPRTGDDVARWATSLASRSGIVGLALVGNEKIQPVGQFKRAFQIAHKNNMPRAAMMGTELGKAGYDEGYEELEPGRLLLPWKLDDEYIQALQESKMDVILSASHATSNGHVPSSQEYVTQRLYDENIPLALASVAPMIYGSSLSDLLIDLETSSELGIDEIEEIALNGLRLSFLGETEKQSMIESFKASYAELKPLLEGES
ncbi:adenosine deaminase [Anaerolineales bacterium]